MTFIRALLVASLALSLVSNAATRDYSQMSSAALGDSLQEIDQQTVGLHATAWVSAFIAEDTPAMFGGGVLGSAAPVIFPQMRELVRRGASSLPELVRHIDDARPTRLAIGSNIFPIQWGTFGDEYDSRKRETNIESRPEMVRHNAFVDLPYTVTVGDVCFVLIGQITNRSLMAVRYQPTGGVLIVSPVREKALAKRVRRDWAGVTTDDLKASLIRDALELPSADGALLRMRLFYPDEFRRQKAGVLRAKIEAFEAKPKNG